MIRGLKPERKRSSHLVTLQLGFQVRSSQARNQHQVNKGRDQLQRHKTLNSIQVAVERYQNLNTVCVFKEPTVWVQRVCPSSATRTRWCSAPLGSLWPLQRFYNRYPNSQSH